MQLPAPANSLAVPPLAASTAETSGGSISRGRDPRRSGTCYWCWCGCFDAYNCRFIISAFSLRTAGAFLLFGIISQVFRVYVLVHGFRYCHVRCIVFITAPCIRVCGLFCFVEQLDGCEHEYNYTTYGFIRPEVSLIMLYTYLVAKKSWYDYPQFEVSARERPSGMKRQVLYDIISDPRAGSAGHESDPPAGRCKFAKRRIRGPDPRVSRKQLVGHGDPTLD